jgi:hypothetical protein
LISGSRAGLALASSTANEPPVNAVTAVKAVGVNCAYAVLRFVRLARTYWAAASEIFGHQ